MAIGFAKNVANVIVRGGGVFFSDDDGLTYEDGGRVKGVVLEWDAEETEEATDGQTVQLAANVTLTAVLQQTSDTEIALVDDLAVTAGLWTKFTHVFTDAAGAGAADGYLFKNTLWKSSGRIPMNNTESEITLTTKFRVPIAALGAFATSGELTIG